MSTDLNNDRTEIWCGLENIVKRSLEVLSKAKRTSDYCHDSKSPAYLVTNKSSFDIIKELESKRVRQRFITEITPENVSFCKELGQHVELRHLDALKGNFGIIDGKKYGAAANPYDLQEPMEFIFSTVKSFVEQQQYFFETLWSKAIPAAYRIREIEEGIPIEKTEVIEGTENVIKKLTEGFARIKESFDNCIDASCPSAYVSTKIVWDQCIQLYQRGIKLRFITEITKRNASYCKEIMKIAELRHLDKLKGNFGIADKCDYRGVADMKEGKPPTQAVRSTVKSFVDQQQYFFETLWNRALPAGKKMREIEEGVPPEVTEIWYGPENIMQKSWELVSQAKRTSDFCHNSTSPSVFVSDERYLRLLTLLTNNGVKHRFVTEITEENIHHCKELSKFVELRHMDGVRGNFAIIDGQNYGAVPNLSENQPPEELILCTVRQFVLQQHYFFETLWNKAIPAEHRIRQIEEGIAPETVETFTDPSEIQRLAGKLVGSAKKELLIVFASAKELRRQQDSSVDGFLAALENNRKRDEAYGKEMPTGQKRLDLRIAVPSGDDERQKEKPTDVRITNQPSYSDSASIRTEIRNIDANLRTMVTVVVIDRMHSLVMEVNDDDKKSDMDSDGQASGSSRGLAIYSNSKALVLSTVSMFELLWNHIELYEEIKLRDAAQREFINIAAHELRGPIQPILGLAEEIRARQPNLGKEGKFLGIILDSATSLQKLANNILDVARIENKSLRLQKTWFNLNELITSVMHNFDNELAHKRKVRIEFEPLDKHLPLFADKDRMNQVISNLLSNAIKFTDEGLVSISAKKIRENVLEVSIRDTGRGIDQEILPRLFTKFATSSAGSSGTGLGLFISQKIVEVHGGHLYGTNSDPSDGVVHGAIFTIILPT